MQLLNCFVFHAIVNRIFCFQFLVLLPQFVMSRPLVNVNLPPTNSGILALPQLKDDTRYQGVPKRYENSKTCSVQNYAHTYIISKFMSGLFKHCLSLAMHELSTEFQILVTNTASRH